MPQAINIVLKNGAGTPVDKTFTLLAPSAGYESVAEWALKEGVISTIFPRITTSVRAAKRVAGRAASKVIEVKMAIPSSYTDTVTGTTVVGSRFESVTRTTVPDDFPEALIPDAVAFTANLANNALIKAMVAERSPAT